MPYCPECGVETHINDSYCRKCGEELPAYNPSRQHNKQRRPNKRQKHSRRKQTEASPFIQGFGVLAALGAVTGVFMPWLEVSAFGATASISGLDFRIGAVTLIAAGVALLLFLPKEKIAHATGGAAGVVVLLLTLAFLNDPLGMEGNTSQIERELTSAIADIGTGAYVTLAGGIGITVCALGSLVSE